MRTNGGSIDRAATPSAWTRCGTSPNRSLRPFDEQMHTAKPNFYSVGESFWLDPNFDSGYQNLALDGTFDFPLAYTIRDVFASNQHRRFLGPCQAGKTVLHEQSEQGRARGAFAERQAAMLRLKLAMQEERLYDNPKKLGTLVDNHDMIRFLSDCGGDTPEAANRPRLFDQANRGVPCVYYGTEVGVEDLVSKRADMEFGEEPCIDRRIPGADLCRAIRPKRCRADRRKSFWPPTTPTRLPAWRPLRKSSASSTTARPRKGIRVPLDRDTHIPDGGTVRETSSPAAPLRWTTTTSPSSCPQNATPTIAGSRSNPRSHSRSCDSGPIRFET